MDLDGARSGEPANDAAIRAITEALTIPVQLGGGVRSAERAEDLLQCGLERVILGTVALEKPELVVELAGRHPGRVIVGIDARHGKVATGVGWKKATPSHSAGGTLQRIGDCRHHQHGHQHGWNAGWPQPGRVADMAKASAVPVIASGRWLHGRPARSPGPGTAWRGRCDRGSRALRRPCGSQGGVDGTGNGRIQIRRPV